MALMSGICSIGTSAGAADADAVPVDAEYFERVVRPILAKRCYECHSQETGPDNGALILDQAVGIAAGGSRGKMIPADAALNSTESLLLRAVRYADVELQMPPQGKLPTDELKVLERWVQAGAPLPEYRETPRPVRQEIDYATARDFWSLRPLVEIAVPAVSDDPWVAGPIDAFLLSGMREQKLRPSPVADRSTLLRRLSFDVTGLPPAEEDIEWFCHDESADAWEKAVDRYLNSAHYGERWARVWLDLARYTDFTPDWQSPTDRGWIYRDWVVDFLNSNRPYDQFLRLQLAADLLPDSAPSDLAALGFLGLSPTYWKELRLAPAVIEQIVADEWDERIDAVSRTFLGLTVSCARCHDHKFDPISAEDYYAIAGVFASTQLDERPLLSEESTRTVREARKQVRSLEDQLKQLQEQKSGDTKEIENRIAGIKQATPEFDAPFAHVVRDASVYVLPDGDELTKLDYREAEPRNLPVFRRGNPANPGDIVQRRYLKVFAGQSDHELSQSFQQGSGRKELVDAMLEDSAGLIARVIVNRIWDQHFGAGLVRTPSDFGSQGERPTHPELLEYLASQFVSHDWDLKWLHRQILLSAAYRQSSAYREQAFTVDPENRLLWRMNRRRLDFEMWRDAVLAANGRLDLTPGGPSKPVDDLNNVRRTLYVTVAREELHPVLRMHDFPEASSHSPRREPTTTPLQQLFVLNSAWMEEQAAALRNQLGQCEFDPDDDTGRLQKAWLLLFSRTPTPQEEQLGLQFLNADPADSGNRQVRWALYLQALMGLNEFHFVD